MDEQVKPDIQVTTPIVPKTVNDTPEVSPVENKHENTIYKHSYWFGKTLCQFFLNFGYGGYKSYSLVVKKGNQTLIHNISVDEKLVFARQVLSRLTPEELAIVLKKDS